MLWLIVVILTFFALSAVAAPYSPPALAPVFPSSLPVNSLIYARHSSQHYLETFVVISSEPGRILTMHEGAPLWLYPDSLTRDYTLEVYQPEDAPRYSYVLVPVYTDGGETHLLGFTSYAVAARLYNEYIEMVVTSTGETFGVKWKKNSQADDPNFSAHHYKNIPVLRGESAQQAIERRNIFGMANQIPGVPYSSIDPSIRVDHAAENRTLDLSALRREADAIEPVNYKTLFYERRMERSKRQERESQLRRQGLHGEAANCGEVLGLDYKKMLQSLNRHH